MKAAYKNVIFNIIFIFYNLTNITVIHSCIHQRETNPNEAQNTTMKHF